MYACAWETQMDASHAHLWQTLIGHGVEPLDDIVCVSEMETRRL